MAQLRIDAVQAYLNRLYDKPVILHSVGGMPATGEPDELKGFGYGEPVLIDYEVDGARRRAVFETIRGGGFGHDFKADRASVCILAHDTFDNLPGHVRSVDAGVLTKGGELKSIGDADEFFFLDEFVEGVEYFRDLERIKESGALEPYDKGRCVALSTYLADIHKNTGPADHALRSELYIRRIRDLVGHGECIMGLIDSYPPDWPFVGPDTLKRIEQACVDWRWRLRLKEHRLCQEHGDYHPWNVLFKDETGVDFWVLDRSRGEYGEAADDVAAMSINYIFYSLQRSGKFGGPFKKLYETFIETYLDKTGDEEILSVVQPYYAWRGLVIASPVWYPHLDDAVRRKVFNFIDSVLATDVFDIEKVNEYLE